METMFFRLHHEHFVNYIFFKPCISDILKFTGTVSKRGAPPYKNFIVGSVQLPQE